jgi:hypothetical protein
MLVDPLRMASVDIIFIANKNPLYSASIFVSENDERLTYKMEKEWLKETVSSK